MLYREIIAVYSEIHTKHTNTLFGQNVEFLGTLAKLWKTISSFVVSVCPSTYNSAPTGRIYTKFDIYFSRNLSRKFKFH